MDILERLKDLLPVCNPGQRDLIQTAIKEIEELREGRMTTTAKDSKCDWCGGLPHLTHFACPMVHAIEFYPDGTIRRVEKMPLATLVATPIKLGDVSCTS
jgi:hypothetical protein